MRAETGLFPDEANDVPIWVRAWGNVRLIPPSKV
jgi:hypothetical protein